MRSRLFIGVLLAVGLVGCGGVDDDWQVEPAGPASFASNPPPSLGTWGTPPAASGSFALSGHLEGQLHVVQLSSDTTINSGDFGLWDDGSGALNVTIAAEGIGGAGMLIVSITSPALGDALFNGRWSMADGVSAAAMVSSCAGPVMGQWDNELPAVGFDMSAEEDSSDPGSVVVQIKAQFPSSYDGLLNPLSPLALAPTTALEGRFSFSRFAALE